MTQLRGLGECAETMEQAVPGFAKRRLRSQRAASSPADAPRFDLPHSPSFGPGASEIVQAVPPGHSLLQSRELRLRALQSVSPDPEAKAMPPTNSP